MFPRTIRSRVSKTAITAAITSLLVLDKEDEEIESANYIKNKENFLVSALQSVCQKASCDAATTEKRGIRSFFGRQMETIRRMQQAETKNNTLESSYQLQKTAIGEGAFGQVFLAKNRRTGESVAVKKIWKEFTNREDCQREMNALLHIRKFGGHPHICSLKENFDEPQHYALVLDLINGGELFDRLVENGAYSELDASRLIREVASAIDFLHGIGIVHGDLKPENLMLSSPTPTTAIIKVVDFGCSELIDQDLEVDRPTIYGTGDTFGGVRNSNGTIAYSSPERSNLPGYKSPSRELDMWALGIILYIMLTGMHPLDIEGDATDEQLKERLRKIRKDNINIIKSKQLKPYTSHLSPSAMDLLLRLLEPNPKKRIRASQLLVHSWIQGTTAFREKMENSDKKLSKFRKFRSKIETKVFQQLLTLSETDIPNDNSGSLFQKAFSSLDKEHKGFLTVDDVSDEDGQTKLAGHDNKIPNEMDLSEFSDLLGEHMVSCYFPSGHILYREGDIGNHMYFVNSGRIQVSTKDGFRATLAHGDTCGEGGLLNENRKRSATLKTQTPVHAIRIDRECFAKYLSSSDSVLGMKLREKVNARKFGRAEYIIGLDKDLVGSKVPMGHVIFNEGDKADGIYILSDGMINVETQNGSKVYDVKPGELFGVQSILMKRDRQALAKCIHPNGCTIKSLSSLSLQNLLETNPSVEETLRELSLRREFRRAVVTKLNRSFKTDSGGLREAFDAIDLDNTGQINIDEVRDLLLNHLGSGSTISEQEIETLLATLDLQRNGVVDFEEFCSIFSR